MLPKNWEHKNPARSNRRSAKLGLSCFQQWPARCFQEAWKTGMKTTHRPTTISLRDIASKHQGIKRLMAIHRQIDASLPAFEKTAGPRVPCEQQVLYDSKYSSQSPEEMCSTIFMFNAMASTGGSSKEGVEEVQLKVRRLEMVEGEGWSLTEQTHGATCNPDLWAKLASF